MAIDKKVSEAPAVTDRAKMVGWYDPGQLVKTGLNVAVSTIFGQYADHRLIEALATAKTSGYYDYTVHSSITAGNQIVDDPKSPRAEIWIDYAADVGEGWNS